MRSDTVPQKTTSWSLQEVVITDQKNSTTVTESKQGSNPLYIKGQTTAYEGLKKHIQRNIKYPPSARENNITGYVTVNVTVENKKISSVEIAKGLQKDVDNEVLRTFNLFKDPVNGKDNTYSMAIIFQLVSDESKAESLPQIPPQNNFIGQIVVTGYKASINSDQKTVNTQTPQDKTIYDFTSVDMLPEFEGGMEGWSEYAKNTLKYPAEAKTKNIEGRIIMSFIVNKEGTLSDIKVLRGLGSGLDEEAVRVLSESPKWKPGIQKGQPVRVTYTMPIFFQLAKKTTN